MSSELANTPVAPGFHKATTQLSTYLGLEPRMMVDTLKKQCFPSMRAEDVSDAQLAAFISVANTMELNPLIPGMLYAYPGKNGGIIPVSGPDGVLKKLDEAIVAAKLDGYECTVYPEDVTLPPTHAIAKIFRAGKDHPSTFTAIFKEWCVGSNPNWSARPRHMLWLRAIKQCARQVIHGVPFDEDDVKIGDMVNITPQTEAPKRPAPPPRAAKGAAAVQENAAKSEAAKNVTVDAEIVTTDKATTSDTATVTASAQPEAPAKKVTETVVEPTEQNEKAKEGLTQTPRDSLKDKEAFTAVCVVEKVWPLLINLAGTPTPSVQAKVSGDFVGDVHHFGGAEKKGDDLAARSEWRVGSKVTLSLVGKLNSKTSKMMTVVNKIVPVEESPDTAMDVG